MLAGSSSSINPSLPIPRSVFLNLFSIYSPIGSSDLQLHCLLSTDNFSQDLIELENVHESLLSKSASVLAEITKLSQDLRSGSGAYSKTSRSYYYVLKLKLVLYDNLLHLLIALYFHLLLLTMSYLNQLIYV